MDVTMIDVTDIEGAEIGDVATIHGTDGTQVLPANRVGAQRRDGHLGSAVRG